MRWPRPSKLLTAFSHSVKRGRSSSLDRVRVLRAVPDRLPITTIIGALNRAMPRHERDHLFGIRFDNLACDCVDQPHPVFFAVANQSLGNFAVSPIGKRVDRFG